ncbi:hypothetical protein A2W14_01805, partial [Candidatus Gottesmanbacteria bacterium RBG_16_37_8]
KTINKLKKIIAEKFGVSQDLINKEADLAGDLNLGSLEISDLLSIIVREFDLHIDENDQIEQVKTVDDLLNLIENYSEEL